jgi:vitamin B12 transporter
VHESEGSVNAEGEAGGPTAPTSTFDAKRHNTAFYSELTATSPAGASLALSARRDDNSDFDAFTTYRAGASVPAGQSSRIRASISTSFNAPAFNQIRPTLFTAASPDLKPERARSWEVGIEQTLVYGILKLSASYFNQRFSDMIQFVSGTAPGFIGSYANLSQAESNGYEAELALTPVGPWSATASYTFAEPRVTRTSSDYAGDLQPGDPLLRRPKHSATGSLTYGKPRAGSLSVIATYVGDRPDFDFNQFPAARVTLPEYYKIDVAAQKEIIRSASGKSGVSITGRVENVMDRKYEDVLNFPAPRRTWMIGARLEGVI